MSEILNIFTKRGSDYVWLILSCGHYYKWSGTTRPKVGSEFRCPDCTRVVMREEPNAP